MEREFCLKEVLTGLATMYKKEGLGSESGIEGELTIYPEGKCPNCTFKGSVIADAAGGKLIAIKTSFKGKCAKES